ncbi:MAG: hypothetical protein AAF664_20925 [Planctomycetota bacterium]
MSRQARLLFLLALAGGVLGIAGCQQSEMALAKEELRGVVRKTCKIWVQENLDLGGLEFDDYVMDVDQVRLDPSPVDINVQFAHKEYAAGLIGEYGIEAVEGGFPVYFTVTLEGTGTRVIDHYASPE